MAVATLTPLPPKEAIAAFTARGGRLAPTFAWQDAWEADHAQAFTVAKSAGFDILKDIYGALEAALKEGTTFQDFAKNLTPVLQAKGWWGKKAVPDPLTGEIGEAQLGSTRRLTTIFDINMRVSYASGQWAQFERTKKLRPWLRYLHHDSLHPRPLHVARHNMCLRVDDPTWEKWAPPNGFGCHCTLQSLSDRDVERMGGQLKFKPPPDNMRTYVNRRTGEISQVPDGIDPGWGYNPGKAGWQASALADGLADAPPALSAALVEAPTWPTRALASEFGDWFDKAAAGAPVSRSSWTVGAIDQATLDGLNRLGHPPQTGAITISQQAVQHMQRDTKAAGGRSVPVDILRSLPATLAQARAVLYDRQSADPALLYVFDVPGENRLGKLVVRVNFAGKMPKPGGGRMSVVTNDIRTAGLVEARILADPATYDVLSGEIGS